MRKEATLEEWGNLYEVAIKLKAMKPWEYLGGMDLIAIQKSEKEICICSIMGMGEEAYGIVAYDGMNSIEKFFSMMESEGMPSYQLMRFQDNMVCNFGNREELTTKERQIIKDLGLTFRGRNNWIYFRRFEIGFDQYMPNKEEVIKLTYILQNLYMAIKALEKIEVDFENGNILFRIFDKKSNQWLNFEQKLNISTPNYQMNIVEDEVLIKKLKKKKQNKDVLELDIAYLNSAIKDKKYDKPLIGRIVVLANYSTGVILSQKIVTPSEDEEKIIAETIIDFILKHERPNMIAVREKYIGHMILNLCSQIGIDIGISTKLYVVDEFIDSAMGFGIF